LEEEGHGGVVNYDNVSDITPKLCHVFDVRAAVLRAGFAE
jgi:hypothetical protein